MVEISLSGYGEGPGWVTAPGYSTACRPLGGKDRPVLRSDAGVVTAAALSLAGAARGRRERGVHGSTFKAQWRS